MPDDRDRARDVLRWLRASNDEGRTHTDAAVEFADKADRNHGRGVLNLLEDEGWARFAGLYALEVEITEAGRNEVTYLDDWEATATAAVSAPAGRAWLLATSPGVLADVLLQRIYDAANASPGRWVGCPPPEPGLSPHAVMAVLWRRMVPAGQVQVARVAPPPDLPDVALTPAGCAHVRAAREVMNAPTARGHQVRSALLGWLHDRRQDPAPGRVTEFLGDSSGAYCGLFFSLDDAVDAARYLQAAGLATMKGRGGRLAVRITQPGIDCVQQGGDITDCAAAHSAAGGADKARAAAANFCGVLAGIGWAAAAVLGLLSKQPTSNLWFILSLVVAVVATALFFVAGGPDLLRWLALAVSGLRRAMRSRR